jgi:hypothetical protein
VALCVSAYISLSAREERKLQVGVNRDGITLRGTF